MKLLKTAKAKIALGVSLLTGYVASASASIIDQATIDAHFASLSADVQTVGQYVIAVILMLVGYAIIKKMFKGH